MNLAQFVIHRVECARKLVDLAQTVINHSE